jgi:hypothetical protein
MNAGPACQGVTEGEARLRLATLPWQSSFFSPFRTKPGGGGGSRPPVPSCIFRYLSVRRTTSGPHTINTAGLEPVSPYVKLIGYKAAGKKKQRLLVAEHFFLTLKNGINNPERGGRD